MPNLYRLKDSEIETGVKLIETIRQKQIDAGGVIDTPQIIFHMHVLAIEVMLYGIGHPIGEKFLEQTEFPLP